MADGVSFLVAAYVLSVVVIVAYLTVLLRRVSRAATRAEELGVDGSTVPGPPGAAGELDGPPGEPRLRSAADTIAPTSEPEWAAGEVSRG